MSNIQNNHSPATDDLFNAILTLKNPEECYQFFSDLLTVQELITFSQRFQAARLLAEGKNYDAVRQQLSISSSTITRINRELCYGAGGYRLALDRLKDAPQDPQP